KYLEVDKHPTAELSVSLAELKVPQPGHEQQASGKGLLRLHGQEKPVAFTYRASESGGIYKVNGTLPIKMTDFGIDVASCLGVTVRPEVEVTVAFKLRKLP